MTVSSKRSENVSWLSLFLSVVCFAIAFFIGRWSGFFAVSAAAWLILSTVLIWFILAIQFHQRALAEQEKLDMSQVTRERDRSKAIFQAKGEQEALMAVAQRRLEVLEKYFLPVFSGALAAYQAGIGLYLLKVLRSVDPLTTEQPFLLCAVSMTAIAFVSFLISRYATGMSAQTQWKPLRAGGSSMLGAAVICFVLALGFAAGHLFHRYEIITVINIAIPVLLIILAIETALNIILDIYRPRLKGQYHRAAFDGRLLGIINEPGGIFRSAASAIDYQFGFQVSQTWFYKLLEKAIMPLIIFGILTLYLMSCVVVVAPDEEAIIEHLGNPITADGEVRLIGPGLAFKWPWPIDKVRTYPTQRIGELYVGFVPRTDPKTGEIIQEKELLWGKEHFEKEYGVLVATRFSGTELADGAVPVSIINANIPVQYRVKDLYSFIYKHGDPQTLLEAICYNELAKFAAASTVEVDSDNGDQALSESLLGAGRAEAKKILTDRIQAAADAEDLGVEIVFLGLQGIHPPVEVAKDYQAVVGAVQEEQALILNAQAEQNSSLALVAGSIGEANALYTLVEQYQKAQADGDAARTEALAAQIDTAFANAQGEIFQRLRKSQGYAFEKATIAKATGERFSSQLLASQAAPEIYKHEQRLRALSEGLKTTRKYVVVPGKDDRQVFIIDVKEKLTPDLYDFTGIEEIGAK